MLISSAIRRLDQPWATRAMISRSREVSGSGWRASRIAGLTAPPHDAASRCARPVAVIAEPRKPCRRYVTAACADASAAANKSPISSNRSDAERNWSPSPAASPCANAAAHAHPRPAHRLGELCESLPPLSVTKVRRRLQAEHLPAPADHVRVRSRPRDGRCGRRHCVPRDWPPPRPGPACDPARAPGVRNTYCRRRLRRVRRRCSVSPSLASVSTW